MLDAAYLLFIKSLLAIEAVLIVVNAVWLAMVVRRRLRVRRIGEMTQQVRYLRAYGRNAEADRVLGEALRLWKVYRLDKLYKLRE